MIAKIVSYVLMAIAYSSAQYRISDFRLAPTTAVDMDLFIDLNSSATDETYFKSYGMSGNIGIDLDGRLESEEQVLYGNLFFSYAPYLWKRWSKDTIYNDDIDRCFSHLSFSEEINSSFYINRSDFFWAAFGKGSIDWFYVSMDSVYQHHIDGHYDVGGGLGYGRMRNGSAAWKAMEIERILLEERIITVLLSRDDIMKLAQIINQYWSYHLKYDRFKKFFYEDVEEYLKTTGICDIPAFIWFRIGEIIEDEIQPREFGYRLGANIELVGNGDIYYMHLGLDSTYSEVYGNPIGRLRITFDDAWPLTYRLQFANSQDFYYDKGGVSLYSSTFFSYRISNELDIRLGHYFDYYRYQYPNMNYGYRLSTQSLDVSFMYCIEDHINLEWGIAFKHWWNKASYSNVTNDFSTGISLTYDVL